MLYCGASSASMTFVCVCVSYSSFFFFKENRKNVSNSGAESWQHQKGAEEGERHPCGYWAWQLQGAAEGEWQVMTRPESVQVMMRPVGLEVTGQAFGAEIGEWEWIKFLKKWDFLKLWKTIGWNLKRCKETTNHCTKVPAVLQSSEKGAETIRVSSTIYLATLRQRLTYC